MQQFFTLSDCFFNTFFSFSPFLDLFGSFFLIFTRSTQSLSLLVTIMWKKDQNEMKMMSKKEKERRKLLKTKEKSPFLLHLSSLFSKKKIDNNAIRIIANDLNLSEIFHWNLLPFDCISVNIDPFTILQTIIDSYCSMSVSQENIANNSKILLDTGNDTFHFTIVLCNKWNSPATTVCPATAWEE